MNSAMVGNRRKPFPITVDVDRLRNVSVYWSCAVVVDENLMNGLNGWWPGGRDHWTAERPKSA